MDIDYGTTDIFSCEICLRSARQGVQLLQSPNCKAYYIYCKYCSIPRSVDSEFILCEDLILTKSEALEWYKSLNIHI